MAGAVARSRGGCRSGSSVARFRKDLLEDPPAFWGEADQVVPADVAHRDQVAVPQVDHGACDRISPVRLESLHHGAQRHRMVGVSEMEQDLGFDPVPLTRTLHGGTPPFRPWLAI